MANEHVLTARDGETSVSFRLTGLKGKTAPSTGVSGHVPPGNYLLVTRKASLAKKAEGKQGFNVHFEDVIVEPAQFAGVPIHSYPGTPVGTPGDSKYDTALRQMSDRYVACASAAGAIDKATANDEQDVPLDFFVGKQFAVALRDGKGDYADRSEIERFLTVDDFKKAPGPAAGFSAPVSRPQSTVPEAAAGAVATGAQQPAPSQNGSAPSKAVGAALGW